MDRREFHAAMLAALAAGLGEPTGAPAGRPAPGPAEVDPGDPLPPGATVRLGSVRFQPLSGMADPGVTALAFAPDGTLLGTLGGQDARIGLWSVPSGRLLCEWEESPYDAESDEVPIPSSGLAFSPDGRLLAVCGLGVRAWEVATGRKVWEAPPAGEPYQTAAVAFAPDGRVLATADGMRGAVTVLDADDGRPLRRFEADPDPLGDATLRADWLLAVAVSPDGRLLAAGGSYEILHRYTGQVPTFAAAMAMLGDVTALDPMELLDRFNKTQQVPEPPDMKRLFDRLAAEYGGCVTREGPDGRQWVPEPRGRVLVWDLDTGERVAALDGRHTHPVRQVGFAPDGSLVSVGENGATHVWDVAAGTHRRELVGDESPRPAVALLPGGRVLVGRVGGPTLLDTLTGAEVSAPLPAWADWSALAGSADGRWLAADPHRNRLEVWDGNVGRDLAPPDRHAGAIRGLAFTPDGAAAVTANDAELFEWDLRTGRRLRAYPVGKGSLKARDLVVSPDGRRVAVAAERPGVKVADRGTGKVRGWRAPGWVSALAWAADGLLIGAWTDKANGLLVLHPCTARSEPRAFDSAPGRIIDLAASPDGRLVAGIGWDNPVEGPTQFLQVWGADGRVAGRFPLPLVDWIGVGALRVRFAPDGRTLAAVLGRGEVFVGPVDGPPVRRFEAAWPADGWAVETALGFTADGRPLVARAGRVADPDGAGRYEARVWDAVAGAEVWRSPPSADPVGPLAFSPDGCRLLAGSRSTTALVWELPAG
jgi:WD40 repeat protein